MSDLRETYEDDGPMPILMCHACKISFSAMVDRWTVERVPCPRCGTDVIKPIAPEDEVQEVED